MGRSCTVEALRGRERGKTFIRVCTFDASLTAREAESSVNNRKEESRHIQLSHKHSARAERASSGAPASLYLKLQTGHTTERQEAPHESDTTGKKLHDGEKFKR